MNNRLISRWWDWFPIPSLAPWSVITCRNVSYRNHIDVRINVCCIILVDLWRDDKTTIIQVYRYINKHAIITRVSWIYRWHFTISKWKQFSWFFYHSHLQNIYMRYTPLLVHWKQWKVDRRALFHKVSNPLLTFQRHWSVANRVNRRLNWCYAVCIEQWIKRSM